jgi:hypothetical protein
VHPCIRKQTRKAAATLPLARVRERRRGAEGEGRTVGERGAHGVAPESTQREERAKAHRHGRGAVEQLAL